jgi:hypothetical protein
MTKVYPTDTSRCALCDCHIKATQHVGLYMVGTRAAIVSVQPSHLVCP